MDRSRGACVWNLSCYLLVLLHCCGCTPRDERAIQDFNRRGVTVHYTMTNYCGTLIQAGNPSSPGPVLTQAGPFAVYTIDLIENNHPEAEDFEFEAGRLFVAPSTTSRAFPPREGRGTMVPRGTTYSPRGRVIIKLDPPTSPEPGLTSLRYERHGGDPPVTLIGRIATGGVVRRDSCRVSDLPFADLP